MSKDDLPSRVVVLETQVKRIVADIESEKGTRARLNSEMREWMIALDGNQRRSDRIIYMAIGGLAVLQFGLTLWVKG